MAAFPDRSNDVSDTIPVTGLLAEHIATTMSRSLPSEVEEKAAIHLLDTVAAMVSGTTLGPGAKALELGARLDAGSEAALVGDGSLRSAQNAALVNGMLAHADETDDSHAPSLTHPGCAIVPAALAMAERHDSTGEELLRAVAVGYDVGTRVAAALGNEAFFLGHHSSHSFGGVFGAAAAAGALAGFDTRHAEYVLAYAVQLASGNTCWRRTTDHVEKAFDFAGMPAHNGVLAAVMVDTGFTGSTEPLEGTPGLFAAYPEHARPELAVEELGSRFEVMRTAVKKWSVGSPIQAALDSMQALMADSGVTAETVDRIDVHLPALSVPVVDDRDMADINLQQQLAIMLHDGTVTFASCHDDERLHEPRMIEMRRRIRLVPRTDGDFPQFPRQAIVDAHLKDGSTVSHKTVHVRGTPLNPMTRQEVDAKARDLVRPVLGMKAGDELVDRLFAVKSLARVRDLRPLLRVGVSVAASLGG